MSISAGFFVPHPPVIIPGIGQGREKKLSATAKQYQIIARRIAAIAPDTVVIITPHGTVYSDYIHISPGKSAKGTLREFGDPQQFEVVYDEPLARRIEKLCGKSNIPAGGVGEREPDLDHGVMIPLYFIGQYDDGFQITRVSPSGLSREDHYRFGMLLAQAAKETNRKTVVIASGDLSHKLSLSGPYGYAPEGPELDKEITEIISSGDFYKLFELDENLCDKGAECGFLPLVMLAGALDGKSVRSGLLSYECPFGVGYAIGAFEITDDGPDRNFYTRRKATLSASLNRLRMDEGVYVRLAREALEAYVKTGELPPLPERLPDELTRGQSGAFVSIKKNGQLRGCIGTTEPTHGSLAEEIRHNAIAAGTQDPRFSPIDALELDELVYSVDVLFPPEPAEPETLDAKRYGVIVSSGRKRGLLLPNLDGVDTVEEQLAIARNKAGIPEGTPCKLERFEVIRHI